MARLLKRNWVPFAALAAATWNYFWPYSDTYKDTLHLAWVGALVGIGWSLFVWCRWRSECGAPPPPDAA